MATEANNNEGKKLHVAIIMDGNGRWAAQLGKERTEGHKKGKKTARLIMRHVNTLSVDVLTLYAFSTENWKRDGYEVEVLMEIIKDFAMDEVGEFLKDNVRVRFIGDRTRLNPYLVKAMEAMESATKDCSNMLLQVAVNYGGQDEILRAANKLRGSLEPITKCQFDDALDTGGTPPVDILIRTGGDCRISNFLLWQSAYAQIEFVDTLWPDFTPDEFDLILEKFAHVERRFGGVITAKAAE